MDGGIYPMIVTPPPPSSSCSDVLSVLNGLRHHEGPDMLSAWGGWGYSSNRYSFPITNPSKDGSKLEKVNFNFEK